MTVAYNRIVSYIIHLRIRNKKHQEVYKKNIQLFEGTFH